MYDRNAVRNIVSAHVNMINRDTKFYPKICFYVLAVVAFLVLNSHDYPAAGWALMLIIVALTVIFLGLPIFVFDDEFQRQTIPDTLCATINKSTTIEPDLKKAIRNALSPDMRVKHLIEVEREYHRVKDITSGPGYSALRNGEPGAPETN